MKKLSLSTCFSPLFGTCSSTSAVQPALILFQVLAQVFSPLAPSAHAQAVPPPAPAIAAPEFPSNIPATSSGIPHQKKVPDVARAGIPTAPSAPPSLTPQKPTNVIRCQRRFIYRGKQLDCDSNLERDAERLRPVFKDVPEAIAELDMYQKTREQVRSLGYAGGLGLGMAFTGFLLSRTTTNEQTARDWRVMGIGGGLLVLGITLATGLVALGNASDHLGNAVKQYNQARPGDPIEFQFSTGFDF